MDKAKRFYIAGPISGYPDFNVHAFEHAAEVLRERGYRVTTPFEINQLQHQRSMTETHEQRIEYMRNNIRALIDECNGIVLLPGWFESNGARLEAVIAHVLDYDVHAFFPKRETA